VTIELQGVELYAFHGVLDESSCRRRSTTLR